MEIREIKFEKIMKISLTAAMLVILTASLMIIQAATTLSRAADDILVLDRSDDTMITGQIIKLGGDDMTLRANGKEINVDLDAIKRDIDVKKLLSKGETVTVQGHFDDDELKARRVITNIDSATGADIRTNVITNDIGDNRHD